MRLARRAYLAPRFRSSRFTSARGAWQRQPRLAVRWPSKTEEQHTKI
jgi:hypothetical protein